jgi:hypothetical protein
MNSEIDLIPLSALQARLIKEIDADKDSLRLYHLGSNLEAASRACGRQTGGVLARDPDTLVREPQASRS